MNERADRAYLNYKWYMSWAQDVEYISRALHINLGNQAIPAGKHTKQGISTNNINNSNHNGSPASHRNNNTMTVQPYHSRIANRIRSLPTYLRSGRPSVSRCVLCWMLHCRCLHHPCIALCAYLLVDEIGCWTWGSMCKVMNKVSCMSWRGEMRCGRGPSRYVVLQERCRWVRAIYMCSTPLFCIVLMHVRLNWKDWAHV
jgi:hypothetical protein